MQTTLLLVRHGDVKRTQSEAGEQLIYGPNEPLSDLGTYQIQSLGKKFSEISPPSIIYTSPTLRAAQSAQLLKDSLANHPAIISKENFRAPHTPQWHDQPVREFVSAGGDIFAKNPNLPDMQGETLTDAYNRAIKEFTRIQQVHPNETVAIVTHGEIIGMIQHYVRVGDKGQPGQDNSIDKGEALVFHLTPEGKVLESQVISPKLTYSHLERER